MTEKEEKPKRTSLRERVLKNISAEGFEGEEREIPVVARMNKRVVETLDSLVAIGVFKSRSEASKQQDAAMQEAQDVILGKLK